MFNKDLIDRLFAEDKDLMTVSPDSVWVIYKFVRDTGKYEIRIESNYSTMYRMYFEINETSKERLIKFLQEVNLWGEDK
jgi:hypothetical protein